MAATAHTGVIPGAEAKKLYGLTAATSNATDFRNGTGGWTAAADMSVGAATKLATARSLGGFNFDGTANIVRWFACTSSASNSNKTVAAANFTPTNGAFFFMWNSYNNTGTDPVTLNVNSTGAKDVVSLYNGAIAPADFVQGAYLLLVTGGGKYLILAGPHRALSTGKNIDGIGYTANGIANRFISCTTGAATAAKAATLSGVLVQYINGLTVNLFLSTANTAANPTLNINSLGAIPIVDSKGAALTGAKLTAGLHHLVYYNSKFYDIGVVA